jgi:hypothetical protein
MVQEVYETHPAIRAAADRSITGHAAKVEADIAEAMKSRGLHADWTAKDLLRPPVRSAALRSRALSLARAFSIGLKKVFGESAATACAAGG